MVTSRDTYDIFYEACHAAGKEARNPGKYGAARDVLSSLEPSRGEIEGFAQSAVEDGHFDPDLGLTLSAAMNLSPDDEFTLRYAPPATGYRLEGKTVRGRRFRAGVLAEAEDSEIVARGVVGHNSLAEAEGCTLMAGALKSNALRDARNCEVYVGRFKDKPSFEPYERFLADGHEGCQVYKKRRFMDWAPESLRWKRVV